MAGPASRKDLHQNAIRAMLVILFVIWSNSFTAIGHLREIFSPLELILARFFPFALFSAFYIISTRGKRAVTRKILRDSLPATAAAGFLSIAAYNFFLYHAQSEIKPGAAALITTLSPLMTLVLAMIFLREKVPLRRILGIVIAFGGLYIVVRFGRIGMGKVTGTADAGVKYALIAALAPLSWSIYTVVMKDSLKRYPAFHLTSLSSLIGTIPFLPLLGGTFISKVALMEASHWIALGHLTLLCTIFGFWMWNFALTRLSTTEVSSFIYLNPPFASFFGWMIFGEEVTLLFLLGSAVVLIGLYLSQSVREDKAPGRREESSHGSREEADRGCREGGRG